MGEKLGGETENSNINKIKYSSKKKFIENWLVNNVFIDNEDNTCNQYIQTDFNTHQDKCPGSSNIPSWNIGDGCNLKRSKKILKLQFKNLLTNIFKKKRSDVFSSYDISEDILTESKLRLLNSNRLKNKEINLGDDMEVRAENKKEQHSSKQKLETQLKKPFVRLDVPIASIKKTTKLDRCNRGFSEVIERSTQLLQASREHSLDDIEDIYPTIVDNREWINKLDSAKPDCDKIEEHEQCDVQCNCCCNAEVFFPLDKWEIPCETEKMDRLNPEISDQSLKVKSSNPAFLPLNSYIKKLELIKNLFHTRLKKVERPKPKPSIPLVINPALSQTNSKSFCMEYSSVLTKDLTEASYLKEHERSQWQGKNRELWFRINAVYKKFNNKGKGKTNDKTIKYPQQSLNLKNVNSDIEKIYYFSRGMTNRSESNLKQRGESIASKIPRYDSLFFDESEAETHVKLEEIFVTDHDQNKRVKKYISTSRDSLKRYVKRVERNGMKRNSGFTRRETADEEKELISREHRCPSKISLTLSSSEWEDVSSQNSDASRFSNPSRFSCSLQKPLPNIPFTPSFKNHFHNKL